MKCLFCYGPEPKYKPETGIDFICSWCVQMLLEADQEDLKRAYSEAIERGKTREANAITSFLIEREVSNDRETKTIRRNLVRERPMREVRPSRNQLRPQQAAIELD